MLALQLFTLVGDFSGFLFGVHHVELVASLRCSVESEQRGSHGRSDFLNALSAFVEERLDATVVCSGEDDVTLVERTVGNEQSRHVAASLVE